MSCPQTLQRIRHLTAVLASSSLLAIAGALAAPPAATAATAATPAHSSSAANSSGYRFDPAAEITDGGLRFDQTSWITAHNAYNDIADPVTNQTWSTREQLDRGVRGLALDLKPSGDTVELCHWVIGCATRERTFSAEVQNVVLPFLKTNPNAIVSLHLEIDPKVTRSQLTKAFNDVSGLAGFSFDPSDWDGEQWPTLEQIVDSGQRLMIFADRMPLSGYYPTDGLGSANVMATNQVTVENHWSMGATIGQHDFACTNRWDSLPLPTPTVGLPGKSWPRLFTMNHLHSVPERLHANYDNRFDQLQSHDRGHCRPASGKAPNFLMLDHVNAGDPHSYVGILNEGGMVLHEGNGGTQDVVCGVPGLGRRSINATGNDRLGCENDEARSAKLVDVKKGMRFVLYDDPNGKQSDDWTEIDVLADAPAVTIDSFEKSFSNSTVRVVHHRHNGLDGKVSRIDVETEFEGPVEPEKPEPPLVPVTASVRTVTEKHARIDGTAPAGSIITVTTSSESRSVNVPASGEWSALAYDGGTGATWTAKVVGVLDGAQVGEVVLTITRPRPVDPGPPAPTPEPCSDKGSQWDPACGNPLPGAPL